MKLRITALLICLASLSALAGECLSLKKTGTTYVYTNRAERINLGAVSFTLPEEITNTFSIVVSKSIIERTLGGDKITTNLWGRVVTNMDYTIASETNVVTDTTLLSVTTTNMLSSQIYSEYSDPVLPCAFVIDEGDRITFSWSDTNTFYFFVHKE